AIHVSDKEPLLQVPDVSSGGQYAWRQSLNDVVEESESWRINMEAEPIFRRMLGPANIFRIDWSEYRPHRHWPTNQCHEPGHAPIKPMLSAGGQGLRKRNGFNVGCIELSKNFE